MIDDRGPYEPNHLLADKSGAIPVRLQLSFFAFLGLRPPKGLHTLAEERLLMKYASNCESIVEIGVNEGASAMAFCQVAKPSGNIYLIDPYPSGVIPGLSFSKFVAHRYLSALRSPNIVWIQDYSFNICKGWGKPVDFLFIDGDHSYEACLQDWRDWNRFIVAGGIVAFHDARIFPGGWTKEDWGPVRVVRENFHDHQDMGWRIIDGVDSLVIARREGICPK